MSDDSVFLLYALLFRFGITAAGLVVMTLGYLLLRDYHERPGVHLDNTAIAEASVLGASFKLKNVMAGSIFAMFGAALIVSMVLQGNPEKTLERRSGGGNTAELEHLRGNPSDLIQSSVQAGLDAESRGLPTEAEGFYHEALVKVAPALNGVAWIYVHQGNAKQGLPFSQTAVELDGENAHYLDTLAEVQFGLGDQASALKTIERAARLDPTFKARADEFRRRVSR